MVVATIKIFTQKLGRNIGSFFHKPFRFDPESKTCPDVSGDIRIAFEDLFILLNTLDSTGQLMHQIIICWVATFIPYNNCIIRITALIIAFATKGSSNETFIRLRIDMETVVQIYISANPLFYSDNSTIRVR